MINILTESGLSTVLTVLPIVIVANILLGAAMAGIDIKEHFNKDKLLKGVAKGFFIYAGIVVYALASYLMKGLSVDFMGQSYNLVDAMYIVILATIIRYAKDGLDKLIEIMKYEHKDERKSEEGSSYEDNDTVPKSNNEEE